MTKAIDILNPNAGVSTSNSDPLSSILNIGKGIRGQVNHAATPTLSSKMTHIDDHTCPKCHQPMLESLIGQEVVYFCTKHAVTLPKAIQE